MPQYLDFSFVLQSKISATTSDIFFHLYPAVWRGRGWSWRWSQELGTGGTTIQSLFLIMRKLKEIRFCSPCSDEVLLFWKKRVLCCLICQLSSLYIWYLAQNIFLCGIFIWNNGNDQHQVRRLSDDVDTSSWPPLWGNSVFRISNQIGRH